MLSIENMLRKALSLLLFFLPWQTIWITREKFLNNIKWEYGTIGCYATEGLLWIAVMLFIAWYWQHARFQIQHSKFSLTKDRVFVLAVFVFLLYCFLGISWALDSDVAWQHAFHMLEAALLFFMLYLGPLEKEQGMRWFIAGATIQSVLGIWQFLSQSTFASTLLGLPLHDPVTAGTSVVVVGIERWLRAYGSFSHPNVFGGYLAVSLICTGFLLWNKQRSAFTKELRIKNYELLLYFSAILQTTALFFTFSRSAWISFAIAFLLSSFLVFLHKKDTLLHISILATAAILAVVFHPLVTSRAIADSPSEYVSIHERVTGYEEARQLFFQRPWLGVGTGNYTLAAFQLNPQHPGWSYQPVHNVFLLFLVEHGIVGAVLMGGIFLTFWLYKRAGGSQEQGFFIVLSLLPIAVVDHYLFSSYVGLLLLAFVLARPQSIHTSSTTTIS